jgi:hypothetical protein
VPPPAFGSSRKPIALCEMLVTGQVRLRDRNEGADIHGSALPNKVREPAERRYRSPPADGESHSSSRKKNFAGRSPALARSAGGLI